MIESLSQPFTFLNASFWAFMLVVLAGMAVSEKRVRVRNAYLFLASLFFYWKTSGAFVAILIFSTLSDWWIGGRMDRSEGAQRKRWLAASLAINLSVLLYFKYAYHSSRTRCSRSSARTGVSRMPRSVNGPMNTLGRRSVWTKFSCLWAFRSTRFKPCPTPSTSTASKSSPCAASWTSDFSSVFSHSLSQGPSYAPSPSSRSSTNPITSADLSSERGCFGSSMG